MTITRTPHCVCGEPVERAGEECLACAMERAVEWCTNCGNRPPADGSTQCAYCLETDRMDRWTD